MKTYQEALQIAVDNRENFNHVRSVYTNAIIMIVSQLYGIDVNTVYKDYYDLVKKPSSKK